jgi:hypothetical protein
MKKESILSHFRSILTLISLFLTTVLLAQQSSSAFKTQNDFWKNVQFGGGIGLSIGSGYTDISLAPSAIYNINKTVALGLGLEGSYVSSKNYYTSNIYGASVIGLINPVPEIQFSAELEELHVSTTYKLIGANETNKFWNTNLFLGAGYRTGNVTIGIRYNVLHDKNKSVYSEAYMPFVRVYF